MDCEATIIGSGQSDLTNKENEARAALMVPYKDFILKQDSGADSGTRLINQTSLSGVMVVDGPNFKTEGPGEYVNQRTLTFAVEAEYLIPGADTAIVSWEESISVRGNGGPDYVWRFPINADAISQPVSLQSLIITIQRGSAKGHTKRPKPPPPFAGRIPGVFVNSAESYNKGSPKSLGKAYIEWPIEWSYEYRSVAPLIGEPSLPPLT